MKNVTIKEVAEQAQVSTATVSRVMNGNYPVSEAVRQRVLAVIEKLQYKPNAIARSLKRNKTNLVGIVVADIANPFFMNVGRGIEDVIATAGEEYNLIFCSTNESKTKEEQIINVLMEQQVDAMVISVCNRDPKMIKQALNSGMEVVLVDRKMRNLAVDCVVNDNMNAAFELTELLIKYGHKEIGIICGRSNTSTAVERFQGFQAAMKHHGLSIKQEYVLQGDFSRNRACSEVNRLITTGQLPSALLCCNNLMAEGALKALKDKRLHIPDDISVVSFGVISNQELIEPQITCIDQNSVLIGRTVGTRLLEKLNSRQRMPRLEVVIPNQFIAGNSVRRIL